MDENLLEKVKQLLDDPETMRSISGMLGGGEGEKNETENQAAQQMEMMMKIKTVMDRMNHDDDPRINLLTALKPYMREGRASHMDKAIRMLQMTRMTSILKDIN